MIDDTHFLMGYFSCQTLLDPLLSHRTGGSFVMFFLCLFVQQSLSLTFRVLFVVFWLLLFVQQSLRWPSEYVNICSRLREGIPDLLYPRFAVFLLVRSAAVSIPFVGVSFSSYWATTCSTPALLIFKTKLVLFLWFQLELRRLLQISHPPELETSPFVVVCSCLCSLAWTRITS